jgi:FAD/FMN-containing dehydrogenase
MDMSLLGFGRYPRIAQRAQPYAWRDLPFPQSDEALLPRGYGRSYGDSCLTPEGGTLLDMRALNRLIGFDAATGVLRCEAGLALEDIIHFALPLGWWPPVLPGTSRVSVGGAIANDIHGKNHHRRGSFGAHVLSFELLRSDGNRRLCSLTENRELFVATVGGLGLTGIITWAELQLMRVPGAWLDGDTQRFAGLDEFFALAAASEATHEYTVAWFDCLSGGAGKLKGVFHRANHSSAAGNLRAPIALPLSVPFTPPLSLLSGWGLRAFNAMYYSLQKPQTRFIHYKPFFFPLDAVGNWNRIYGPRGLIQYQCVVPTANASAACTELLARIARSGRGSLVAVLKTFGSQIGVGTLSFARPGTTLALDFPADARALALLDNLDRVVLDAGGAVYPAKDARLAPETFQTYFPQWREVEKWRDPALQSAFWQRVTRAG